MGSKWTSREFLLIVALLVFALASASGILKPSHITAAADNLQKTQDALPKLIDAVTRLLDSNGPLMIFAAAVWAYIKRRNEQKLAEGAQSAEVQKAQAEVLTAQAKAREYEAKKRMFEIQKS